METYSSVKETASRFGISRRRVQTLCEQGRLSGATMISGVWLIPTDAVKPQDARISESTYECSLEVGNGEQLTLLPEDEQYVSLEKACELLSISTATGNNWLKLGKWKADQYIAGKPVFTKASFSSFLKTIHSEGSNALKSRRNKKHISGTSLYKDYIENQSAIESVEQILEQVSANQQFTEHINLIIAEYAIKLLKSAGKISCDKSNNLLSTYLNGEIDLGKYSSLIDDFILDDFIQQASATQTTLQLLEPALQLLEPVLNYDITYTKGQDVLGLLYISLQNLGDRKAAGAYYTPVSIAREMVEDVLAVKELVVGTKVIDPCCGTGNFLICVAQHVQNLSQLFGQDIDSFSVSITRLNLALALPFDNVDDLYKNITCGDTLLQALPNSPYDIVIGNPPWGYDFPKVAVKELCSRYETAAPKGMESYDLFLENALRNCAEQGLVSFILPEAIMNVKSHQTCRRYIMDHSRINKVTYVGNIFNNVQCPAVILMLKKSQDSFSTQGVRVKGPQKEFQILTNRNLTEEYFNFNITDEEYLVLQKIEGISSVAFLRDNADFALGIVTGDNKKYVTSTKTEASEVILKGSNIQKYKICPSDNYIEYVPGNFQQVAPNEYYRAPEKLLYRFICDRLVFAYDNQKTLSLNSCNILIPRIEGLSVKYILAILNSRVAQFYCTKKFNSIKVLRSHIEQIPIPHINLDQQAPIVENVNSLLSSAVEAEINRLYEKIDLQIMELYGLDSETQAIIANQVNGKNNFLY